jgi:hypothetical protein
MGFHNMGRSGEVGEKFVWETGFLRLDWDLRVDEFLMGFGRRMVPNWREIERSLLDEGSVSILLKVVHILD